MRFTMRRGVLSTGADRKVCAVLRGVCFKSEKRVFSYDGTLALRTDARRSEISGTREYVMLTSDSTECATARPRYSTKDDPDRAGWPIARAPYMDHVHLFWEGYEYRLTMDRSQNYLLSDTSHAPAAQFHCRGMLSGWDVEARDGFTAELLCDVFAFGQYLREENKLYIV